ncbi:uncharacterized protein N7518_007164 [Penicillium psychrosexuale]|uniref:uncharacterized protein n=1 Tax=Penicillium psychrosexuale TaxID=1002107 RepID=UPI002545514C|nr:uncharacterized protein N7518_007164 [Penicillium psychrosexuale]KAJ5790153.1 hypothetical protein N7518_007164 [Penicillium psychrosexuale]
MTNNTGNASTNESYLEQASDLAQRAIGTVTGTNTSTQTDEHKHEAKRDNGSWDQTIGSAKESVGNLIGNQTLRRTGAEQNAAGKEQEAKSQLQNWGEGIENRAQGAIGSIGAAVTGNRSEEDKYRDLHDEGKAHQLSAEADMIKKNAA